METWNINYGNGIEIEYTPNESFSIEQGTACLFVEGNDLIPFLQWLTDIEYCADNNRFTFTNGREIKSVRHNISEYELQFDQEFTGHQVIKFNSDEIDELCNNLM
jgi:hypothetical protein